MEMITSWKREGIEEGLQRSLHVVLKSKYGEAAHVIQSKLNGLSSAQLEALLEESLAAESIEVLQKWLDNATQQQK